MLQTDGGEDTINRTDVGLSEPKNMDKWRCLRCGERFDEERGKVPFFCPNPNCGFKGPYQALSGPFIYFEISSHGPKFVPKKLADKIMMDHRFATHRQSHVIWTFTNGVYEPRGEELIRADCRTELESLAKEGHVQEVVKHIQETTFTEPEKFNAPIDFINLKNGVYNLKTGELTPHSPDVIFTNELPVEYNEHVGCPDIMQFLSEILQPDDIPLIQELVGYCLLRDYPFAKAFMFLGGGANAKSTLLRLVIKLLGDDNVATPALHDLVSDRFAKAQLYGKLANIHADLPPDKLKHTGAFKMLTGQDKIYAQLKHQNPFDFYNYAKLIYSANELPETDDMSTAFWRRWIIVKFINTFLDGDPKTNPNILEKLTTPNELSGFLSWAIAGLKRLLDQKHFTTTKTRDQVEDEWIMRTDSLRAFCKKHAANYPEYFVPKETFYEQYCHFCDFNDIPALDKSVVGRRMPTIFPYILDIRPKIDGKKQVRCWKGIAVTDIHNKLCYFWQIPKGKDDSSCIIVSRKDVDICLGEEQPPEPTSIRTRLFEAFGTTPFKVSQLPEHFHGDDLKSAVLMLPEMEKRGEAERWPFESEGIEGWQLRRKQ